MRARRAAVNSTFIIFREMRGGRLVHFTEAVIPRSPRGNKNRACRSVERGDVDGRDDAVLYNPRPKHP